VRLLIATVQVPFVRGGAEMLADGLHEALTTAGHEAEIVRLPFKWYPPERLLEQVLAARLFDLTESSGTAIDRVIGLRFPAYLLPHPDKVLWLLHQYRTAYDLWGTELCELMHAPNGEDVRDAIRAADTAFIPEAHARYTISANVANRLRAFCGIDAEALYHPPPAAALLRCAPAEDFFFLPSRFNRTKRQLLIVEALALCREPVRVRFSGPTDDAVYAREVRDRVEALALAGRVDWLDSIGDEAKSDLYARCLGVVFAPIDEDYGYVTLEAMLARKPVITCSDSGGPLELVRPGENGFVCAPDAKALATAYAEVSESPSLAERLGAQGRRDVAPMSWDAAVKKLVLT